MTCQVKEQVKGTGLTSGVIAPDPYSSYRERGGQHMTIHPTSEAETRAVVHRYLSALIAGEVETVAALFAEPFDWQLNDARR